MLADQDIKWLTKNCKAEITPCGSRVTCNPPPTDTDTDYLVFIPSNADMSRADAYFNTSGWKWEGDCEHYQIVANNFMSYRKGDVNFIVSKNPDFIKRHKVATYVCTTLNVMNKFHRVVIFQAVLYGNKHS